MKRVFLIALCMILAILPALAEDGAAQAPGFDAPALTRPEARYEQIFEETDGSEQVLFALLDSMNDEAADIEQYGALYITESMPVDENGEPLAQAEIMIQDSVYGKMMIANASYGEDDVLMFTCGTVTCMVQGTEISIGQLYEQEEFDFFCESYHFPYGNLEALNGTRQDDNGYSYFLVRSDDDMSFEFVAGENMRIEQLRVYVRDDDGVLTLLSYADYATGEAVEVPQQILDILGDYLEELSAGNAAEAAAPSAE